MDFTQGGTFQEYRRHLLDLVSAVTAAAFSESGESRVTLVEVGIRAVPLGHPCGVFVSAKSQDGEEHTIEVVVGHTASMQLVAVAFDTIREGSRELPLVFNAAEDADTALKEVYSFLQAVGRT